MKAELIAVRDENPELAGRIHLRWIEWIEETSMPAGVGWYDGCVQSDEEAAVLVRSLPDDLRKELAFGPMPEPRCTVCMALNRERLVRRNVAVCALLDYHDASKRDGTERHRWSKGGAEAYRRCCVIYQAADPGAGP